MHSRLPPRMGLLGILLVLVAGACAPRPAVSTPFTGEGGGTPTLRLTVDNQDFRDATIYTNWNGARNRVGMVVGKTTETFTVAWRDYQVRLEVDFIGGGEMKIAEPIGVQPGEHIDFIIMPGW
jgi:hypothetical protein